MDKQRKNKKTEPASKSHDMSHIFIFPMNTKFKDSDWNSSREKCDTTLHLKDRKVDE